MERSSNLAEEEPMLPVKVESGRSNGFSAGCICCRCTCCCCVLLLVAILVMGGYGAVCVRNTMSQPSITKDLAKDSPGGNMFTLKNMSVVPTDQWKEYSAHLHKSWTKEGGYTFGYADVDDAPRLLNEASKVEGVWDKVPKKLRGVYWMRGNPLPEVLAVIQYGKWFDEQRILLLPNTPWTWAWYGGVGPVVPSVADMVTKLTYRFTSGKSLAESYTDASGIDTLVSFKFETCPGDLECEEGSTDLTYASLMSHPDGNLEKHGMQYYDGYTMEEMPKEVGGPGSLYFRRAEVLCGLFGRGSGYELTKILDADGNKIEPYYTEYQQFMEGQDLIIWSGFSKKK